MSAANPQILTSETPILDGEVYRQDWEGLARFYCVKIRPWDPREAPRYPHLYTPRVQVEVTLKGDPTAWSKHVCDDDPESINEQVRECVAEVEQDCIDEWEAEQETHRRQMNADYWRSRI